MRCFRRFVKNSFRIISGLKFCTTFIDQLRDRVHSSTNQIPFRAIRSVPENIPTLSLKTQVIGVITASTLCAAAVIYPLYVYVYITQPYFAAVLLTLYTESAGAVRHYEFMIRRYELAVCYHLCWADFRHHCTKMAKTETCTTLLVF